MRYYFITLIMAKRRKHGEMKRRKEEKEGGREERRKEGIEGGRKEGKKTLTVSVC